MTTTAWILLFCAVPAVLFTVGFGVLERWWRTAFGWHIMAYSVVVATILTLAVLYRMGLDVSVWVTRPLYVLLGLVLWHRLGLLVWTHWRKGPP